MNVVRAGNLVYWPWNNYEDVLEKKSSILLTSFKSRSKFNACDTELYPYSLLGDKTEGVASEDDVLT